MPTDSLEEDEDAVSALVLSVLSDEARLAVLPMVEVSVPKLLVDDAGREVVISVTPVEDVSVPVDIELSVMTELAEVVSLANVLLSVVPVTVLSVDADSAVDVMVPKDSLTLVVEVTLVASVLAILEPTEPLTKKIHLKFPQLLSGL